ncbi:MAG TPA: ferritin-like domain-containing protein [Chthoniobacteraceae bacterium]|nr:ferritin-like domain-containing protein [Chthoniobacteraceae bacterium]
MKLESLRDLYIAELRDLYSAEKQLTKALPKMAKAAGTPELKEAFESHLEETEGHVTRLEKIFEELDEKPTGETCEAMKRLIEEGEHFVKAKGESQVIDAGLIAAAQRVEHYEIAGYGTARTLASHLGEEDAAELLQETLDEEGAADKKLTSIAESLVNPQAAGSGE